MNAIATRFRFATLIPQSVTALTVIALLAVSVAHALPQPAEVYFVPMNEQQLYAVMAGLGHPESVELREVVSIAADAADTYIYYDHWEDGYEPEIANPTQATTQVWGDNDPANGIPPGFATDVLGAGTVIALDNLVNVPHTNPAVIAYGTRDKLAATRPVAVAFSCWPTDPGPVLADGNELYDVGAYGTNFFAPVGKNVGPEEIFEYSGFMIMSALDATFIEVDKNADGTFETSATIDAGESYHVDGGVKVGAQVRASRPVQVHLVTGDKDASYEMRWYTLYPRENWSSSYYMPVGETDDSEPVAVFVYNPYGDELAVRVETTEGVGYLSIPARSTLYGNMPEDSGAELTSTNGKTFSAVLAADAEDNGTTYDWGAALVPAEALTPQVLVGWGPGSADLSANGSPVWVVAEDDTVLLVDYDGDPTTGTRTDHNGRKYNRRYEVDALESTRIFDNNDNDQTGMRIYTTNGVRIAAMWGEDPDNASSGNPYLDIGTAVLPIPNYSGYKTAVVTNEIDFDGQNDPGEKLYYTIFIRNDGYVALTGVRLEDTLPENVTYVAASTKVDGVPISDAGATAFPLDEGGVSLGSIPPQGTRTINYKLAIDDPFPLTLDGIVNVADVSTHNAGALKLRHETFVAQSDLELTKDVDNPTPALGEQVVFSLTLLNKGPWTATGIKVQDILPAGLDYVSHSGGNYNSANGVWQIASLANGASKTLRITATAELAGILTNATAVTEVDEHDPDSDPDEDDDDDDFVVLCVKRPFVDITNAYMLVGNDTTAYPVAGTNNIQVVGTMWVVNETLGSPAQLFPAVQSWITPDVPLAEGANTITVYGTNRTGRVASDTTVISRGGIGTGAPFVDVTNDPFSVTYDITETPVAGTNNIHVVGGMTVSNTANGEVRTFPAAETWITPSIPLEVGDNLLIVIGTNLLNETASDTIVVTRCGIGTGAPFIDITNAPMTVTYDVAEIPVAGTNNLQVVGTMTVRNTANGEKRTFPASQAWITPALPLDVGLNRFVVTGTNALGESSTDLVDICRGGIGTGRPFVDVTNAPFRVTYDVAETPIAGTNNIHVVGGMTVSNAANGEVRTFPAAETWITPSIPLDVGDNLLIVIGTNLLNQSSSDSVVVTRGGIGTGLPFVDITNAPFTVAYAVTAAPVSGTNNIHVIGGMTVANAANGEELSFPAAETWTTPPVPLVVGSNTFTVTGTNLLDQASSDTIVIVRLEEPVGPPFVDITNDNTVVTYDVTEFAVAGTNNSEIVGGMTVSNAATGVSQTFPAATPWIAPALPLAPGGNIFIVSGTNALGEVAVDSVVVSRGCIGTGVPFVDITNAPVWVTYDATEFAVAGSNNLHVVGGMTVSNATNGEVGYFTASRMWIAAAVPLELGDNLIVVSGTNELNQSASDSVVITRGGIGTGEPFVDATNPYTVVTYDVTEYAVAGTNNIHVVGGMLVSNIANGQVRTFPAADAWTTPTVPLDPGMNEFVVTGSNLLNRVVCDHVVIARGFFGTGTPFVDITNQPRTVTYDVTEYVAAGTNNLHVVGGMTISNAANGAVRSFPATPAWTAAAVPLAVGANELIVTGTNLLNVAATDSIVITRGGIGTGEPFVDITNETLFVSYDVTAYAVAGTNNIHVVGGMTVVNLANDDTDTFPAEEAWTTPALALEVGSNEFVVTGTNLLHRWANDRVVIVRGGLGTGAPFVDITNTPVSVSCGISEFALGGTNNPHVVGGMTVSNAANGELRTFPAAQAWISAPIPLEVGENMLVVVGSNLLNRTASDSIVITREPYGMGEPFVDITNGSFAVNHDITATPVAGTNNLHVLGGMTALNAANAEVLSFPAAETWITPSIPLVLGANEITVLGTNMLGDSASDMVVVTRRCPGTGAPFVDITNELNFVTYDLTAYAPMGTNNLEVVGDMTVLNTGSGDNASFPAAYAWTAPELPLVVGANEFIVTGTNVYGDASSDCFVLERGGIGTGRPFVDITNTYLVVSFDADELALAGTNNLHVIGGMTVSNTANGAMATFPAASAWSTPEIPLELGVNELIVMGSNLLNEIASDSVIVARGGYGTDTPFVDCTNDVEAVAHGATEFALAGTNNLHVIGGMTASNAANGAVVDFPAEPAWIAPALPLEIGPNALVVIGSNLLGDTACDRLIIERGGNGFGTPVVDVTNEPVFVTYDIVAMAVAGTNNEHVIGGMTVSNTATGAMAEFPAAQSWLAPELALAVGSNEFIVTGTNLLDEVARDSVVIVRGGAGTGTPFVDITTSASIVPYSTPAIALQGTNNMHVVGMMTVVNAANASAGSFPAGLTWTATSVDLAIGANALGVSGTNVYGDVAGDGITVNRLVPPATVALVAPNDGDGYETRVGVHRTNLTALTGGLVTNLMWTNMLTGVGGELPVSTEVKFPVDLVIGSNEIGVIATGPGGWGSDQMTIIVGPPSGVPSNTVLCTWPQLIGQDQTGTVEFISTMDTTYRLFAVSEGVTQNLSEGVCSRNWNQVPFYSDELPAQLRQGTNALFLQLGDQRPLFAYSVCLVPDLKIGVWQSDFDTDMIKVKYKASVAGRIRAKGRTLYIENGAPNDKLFIKVKRGLGGDKACHIAGVLSDSGCKVVKLDGSVDRVLLDGPTRKVMSKRGDLGQRCYTRLRNLRFDSVDGKAKIKAKFGNILGNILVGRTTNATPWYMGAIWTNGVLPETVVTQTSAKMVAALGGELGRIDAQRFLQAASVKKLICKKQRKVGGDMINYSMFLSDEYMPGTDYSIKTMLVDSVIDTSGSNLYTTVVCGYRPGLRPTQQTTWTNQPVRYSIKKVKAKGDLFEGTYVLDDEPLKKKINGVEKALWLIYLLW